MPRKSLAASFAVVVEPPRLRPPATLSAAERKVFTGVVRACAPEHFRAGDIPLLTRFCELTVLAELAARELRNGAVVDGRPSPWIVVQERCIRNLLGLAAKLRLAPSARLDPKTLGREPQPTGLRKPWV
jgi:phage terminase small subunit